MPNARAGIGVFFGVDSPRNISRGLEGNKETNNTAEVKAILAAVDELKFELERGDDVVIHTDSTYALRVCSEYGETMSKRGWKTVKGQLIPNAELVKRAWEMCRAYPNLRFVHVYGHMDDDDPLSIGNNHADRLALAGAGGRLRTMRPPADATPRRPSHHQASTSGVATSRPTPATGMQEERVEWLVVAYAQKDQAKSLGARWNPNVKRWYVPGYVGGGRRAELLRRWGQGRVSL